MKLTVEKLSKIYKLGTNDVVAVDNLDLVVEDGEFIAIMGPSGCGKTTLLHMLGGLDKPTSGKIFVGDTDISTLSDKKLSKFRSTDLGFIFQKFNLLDELTVKENIVMPVLISNGKPDEEYIDGLCDVLGISERLEHTPLQLSGGQQQRVAIARALANKPGLILCDEPTGNLDAKNSKEVIELLGSIHEKYKRTIVMVTHDLEVAKMAYRIIHMSEGRVC